VVIERLRGGVGYARHGDKAYREPMYAAGFHGEQVSAGAHAAAAQGKPAKWYVDPAGPKPKIAWLGEGSARGTGRPLWEAPMAGGGTRGGSNVSQIR
jgi:hypothetical protein